MFGLGTLASLAGSFIGGPLTAITGQIAGYFTNAKTVEAAEYASMTAAQQAEYLAAMKAYADGNRAKVANNASWVGHVMVLAFGLPPAIYLGMVFITAAFPSLGLAAYPLKGDTGIVCLDIAKTIALSFFIYVPAMSLTSWIKGR